MRVNTSLGNQPRPPTRSRAGAARSSTKRADRLAQLLVRVGEGRDRRRAAASCSALARGSSRVQSTPGEHVCGRRSPASGSDELGQLRRAPVRRPMSAASSRIAPPSPSAISSASGAMAGRSRGLRGRLGSRSRESAARLDRRAPSRARTAATSRTIARRRPPLVGERRDGAYFSRPRSGRARRPAPRAPRRCGEHERPVGSRATSPACRRCARRASCANSGARATCAIVVLRRRSRRSPRPSRRAAEVPRGERPCRASKGVPPEGSGRLVGPRAARAGSDVQNATYTRNRGVDSARVAALAPPETSSGSGVETRARRPSTARRADPAASSSARRRPRARGRARTEPPSARQRRRWPGSGRVPLLAGVGERDAGRRTRRAARRRS